LSDRWQRQGLGTELLKELVQIARAEKLSRVSAVIMATNRSMQHVAQKAGFRTGHDLTTQDYIAEIHL